MKERLRVMGLLESSVAIPKIVSQLENQSDASSDRRKPSSLPAPPTVAETPKAFQAEKQWEPLYPPPPPLEEELTSQGNESKHKLIAVELRRKAVEYKRVLSELEKAKRAASESFNELMNLRNSLQIIPSSQSNMEKADELEASVSEADNLLQ
eukprot:gene38559-46651_t